MKIFGWQCTVPHPLLSPPQHLKGSPWLVHTYPPVSQLRGVLRSPAGNGHDSLMEILRWQVKSDSTPPPALCLDCSFHFLCCDVSPQHPLPQPGSSEGREGRVGLRLGCLCVSRAGQMRQKHAQQKTSPPGAAGALRPQRRVLEWGDCLLWLCEPAWVPLQAWWWWCPRHCPDVLWAGVEGSACGQGWGPCVHARPRPAPPPAPTNEVPLCVPG